MTKNLLLAVAATLIGLASTPASARQHHGMHRHHHHAAHHHRHRRVASHRHRRHAAHGSRSLTGVKPILADKVQQIVADCGSTVTSAVRHTRVAGSRRWSQHANGTAVDVAGNPSCIYAHLKGWTAIGGGYSRDYGAVRHVHISYGGAEAGIVFSHRGRQYRVHGYRHYASRRARLSYLHTR